MIDDILSRVDELESRALRFLLYFLVYSIILCFAIGVLFLVVTVFLKYPIPTLIGIGILVVGGYIGILAWEGSR